MEGAIFVKKTLRIELEGGESDEYQDHCICNLNFSISPQKNMGMPQQ